MKFVSSLSALQAYGLTYASLAIGAVDDMHFATSFPRPDSPKIPSCNAALIVALLLHHVAGIPGMTKEQLMVLAEEGGVSRESMGGYGGFYDGWAGMKMLLQRDPALVRKEKGHKYSLTIQVNWVQE